MVRVEYIDGKSEEFVTVENEYSYFHRTGYATYWQSLVKNFSIDHGHRS